MPRKESHRLQVLFLHLVSDRRFVSGRGFAQAGVDLFVIVSEASLNGHGSKPLRRVVNGRVHAFPFPTTSRSRRTGVGKLISTYRHTYPLSLRPR
jgi:hypothetical protein